ncbi:hypothetical protein COSO111634_04915 [Corallococcus soli]
MAGNRDWGFIRVGLLLGWLGAGCGTSDTPRTTEGQTAPPVLTADDDTPGAGTVVDETDAPPAQADTGTPTEEPLEEEPPPNDPGPSECEGIPDIQPEALGAWTFKSQGSPTYGWCSGTNVDGAGNVYLFTNKFNAWPLSFTVWLQGGGTWGAELADTGDFYATSQAQGLLGHSSNIYRSESEAWLTFVDAANRRLVVHPLEPSRVMAREADPTGGVRALLEDGTLKAYSATGQLLWHTSVSERLNGRGWRLGVNTQGHTLVLAVGPMDSGAAPIEALWVEVRSGCGGAWQGIALAPRHHSPPLGTQSPASASPASTLPPSTSARTSQLPASGGSTHSKVPSSQGGIP